MERETYLKLQETAKQRIPKMSMYERCSLVDELDSHWYADWCEREGTQEELTAYLYELLRAF